MDSGFMAFGHLEIVMKVGDEYRKVRERSGPINKGERTMHSMMLSHINIGLASYSKHHTSP
jgi:hypothetical protein